MKATVIAIGDELLAGKVVNNNAAYISSELNRIGIPTVRQIVVGDNDDEIRAALDIARSVSGLAIMSGGLGPTDDDITLKTVADYFERETILHRPTLKHIESLYVRRKKKMPSSNLSQAMIPSGAKVLRNELGTAPGILIEEEGFILCLTPGVPAEMEYVIKNGLIPYLDQKGYSAGQRYERQLRVTGIPESKLGEIVSKIAIPKGLSLGYYPQVYEVLLRLSGYFEDEKKFKLLSAPIIAQIYSALGSKIYGEGERTLSMYLGDLLRKRKLTLATAESCTGGLIAKRITDAPGSSEYFKGSAIAYDNDIKMKMLGVLEQTLIDYGAVSEPTVKEMAVGARKAFDCDIAVSTSGVAGPGGGTTEKPVGTVCLAVAHKDGVYSEKVFYSGGRDWIRERAAQRAMNIVRLLLPGKLK